MIGRYTNTKIFHAHALDTSKLVPGIPRCEIIPHNNSPEMALNEFIRGKERKLEDSGETHEICIVYDIQYKTDVIIITYGFGLYYK